MKPTEQTKRHVIARYVEPARSKGEKTIQVRVGNVQKELGWTNRTPSVFSTLISKEFQQEAGVALIERTGGPPSGGPSTTWQFVYRLLEEGVGDEEGAKAEPKEPGLLALYGICSDGFRALGGGEEFLRRERSWGADAWDRYEGEKRLRENAEAAE
jgi:hypothetical protein